MDPVGLVPAPEPCSPLLPVVAFTCSRGGSLAMLRPQGQGVYPCTHCPQLCTPCLASRRHLEILCRGSERKKGRKDWETAGANHPGLSLSFKALNCCLDSLSQDGAGERGRGTLAEPALCDWRLLDTVTSCLSSICFYRVPTPDFPRLSPLGLRFSRSPLSSEPCLHCGACLSLHDSLPMSPLPPCHPGSELLEPRASSSPSCAQCPEQGLARYRPSRLASSVRQRLAVAGAASKDSAGGIIQYLKGKKEMPRELRIIWNLFLILFPLFPPALVT